MPSLRRHSLGLAAFALLAATSAGAQEKAPPTPEDVGRKYVATLTASDFAGNASLMDPAALTSVRHLLEAVARKGPTGTLNQLVGVSDTVALRALPDTVLYARFLKATFGAQTGLADAMKTAKATFIGHVDEPPDLTHVVYRLTMTLEGITMRKVDVITLRRSAGQWKAMLSADIENLIARLSAP